MDEVLFSSKSNEWETPQDFFNWLDGIFKFTLDPCATDKNKKCKKFYTVEDDGLTKDWSSEKVFMNPPYGKNTPLWMEKAYTEAQKGALVVCLVNARVDTRWWHDWAMKASEIWMLKGRLKFKQNGEEQSSAPFPSAVIIFKPKDKPTSPTISSIIREEESYKRRA